MSPSFPNNPAFPSPAVLAGRARRWRPRKGSRQGARRGFTIMEAAMATVIIGTGFISVLSLLAAGTGANGTSTELTTAIHLAGNIREAAVRMSYNEVFTLERNYSPAVDGELAPLTGMEGWSQSVNVNYVDPNLLTADVPDTQVEPTARVTVIVNRNGQPVYRMSWLVAASG